MSIKNIPLPGSSTTTVLATTSLALYTQRADIDAKMKEIGLDLIEIARGDTMAITIPNMGKVTVTKPSEPSPVPGEYTYTFSQEAFLNLSPATRRSLQNAGVVIVAPKVKGGSSASVRHTPNK